MRSVGCRLKCKRLYTLFTLVLSGATKTRRLAQRAICSELNGLGVKNAKGREWSLIQLQRVIVRL